MKRNREAGRGMLEEDTGEGVVGERQWKRKKKVRKGKERKGNNLE